jgi:hypothetical protein
LAVKGEALTETVSFGARMRSSMWRVGLVSEARVKDWREEAKPGWETVRM